MLPDGILYASTESHYSVFKAARMYRMECEKVDTLISGEIDCDDLRGKLLANKVKPAILNVNIGVFFSLLLGLCVCLLMVCYFLQEQRLKEPLMISTL